MKREKNILFHPLVVLCSCFCVFEKNNKLCVPFPAVGETVIPENKQKINNKKPELNLKTFEGTHCRTQLLLCSRCAASLPFLCLACFAMHPKRSCHLRLGCFLKSQHRSNGLSKPGPCSTAQINGTAAVELAQRPPREEEATRRVSVRLGPPLHIPEARLPLTSGTQSSGESSSSDALFLLEPPESQSFSEWCLLIG